MRGTFAVDGYQLGERLEHDPACELWLARDHATGERVALRRLVVGSSQVQDKARRLSSVLGRLDHPGLLNVRELITRRADLVLVRDFAGRGSLERLLFLRGTLDPGEVVTIASAAAEALAALHAHGVVHGGVSPQGSRSTLSTRDDHCSRSRPGYRRRSRTWWRRDCSRSCPTGRAWPSSVLSWRRRPRPRRSDSPTFRSSSRPASGCRNPLTTRTTRLRNEVASGSRG